MQIPPGTAKPEAWRELCLYKAFTPHAITRIDRLSTRKHIAYTRLLNYLMMRALDAEPDTRISAHDLYCYLCVLEPLVRHLFESGQSSVFEERDGISCEISDSHFFRWFLEGLAYSAFQDYEHRRETIPLSLEPVRLMNDDDRRACLELADEMGIHELPVL
jgi:hypothetical protein